MKYEAFNLNEIYDVKGGRLTAIVADILLDRGEGSKRPAVIVVPGGGYWFCSKREQEPVAFEFLARGYNVFILEYLCAPDGVAYPEQLLELAVSVDFVRNNAGSFNVNPNEIFAVGFSAGGHLVASLSTDYTIAQKEYGKKINPELTAAGLIYPVISDRYGHVDSHNNLHISADKACQTRMDEQVCSKTAPAYIFSTYMDKTVPSMNALRYAQALAENDIPYELHVYKNGGHGMSTANAEINETVSGILRNRSWPNDCAEFFRDFVEEKF